MLLVRTLKQNLVRNSGTRILSIILFLSSDDKLLNFKFSI